MMKMKRTALTPTCRIVVALLVSFCSVLPAVAACNSYYVAPWGNDGNPGSLESPWQTIGKAAGTAVACDTVQVRAGTYAEEIIIRQSGTAEASISFVAYPGELPIVDGENLRPGPGGALVYVGGSYVQLSGFEIRNSAFYGVHLEGHHNTAQNLNVHHTYSHGILARGDYSVVERCQVWQASLNNLNGAESSTGLWGAGLSAARDWVNGITEGAILRGNIVYHNWGEGLSAFEAEGTIVEDNIVSDNWSANLYISDATNVVVQRNMVYTLVDNPIGVRRCGICLSDESEKNPSRNITIINNLVYGTRRNLVWFLIFPDSKMDHVLIAHNTFVSGDTEDSLENVTIQYGAHENVRFVNNIVHRTGSGNSILIDTRNPPASFSNNLWSVSPQAEASGPGDVVGDAGLRMSPSDARWFKLKRSSPAARRATVIDSVAEDFFGNPRTSMPDIGAHQRSR